MSQVIGHTVSNSNVPTTKLVDFGHEVVRVKIIRYTPESVWTSLTFLRPAYESIPAQSFEMSLSLESRNALIKALTDETDLGRKP